MLSPGIRVALAGTGYVNMYDPRQDVHSVGTGRRLRSSRSALRTLLRFATLCKTVPDGEVKIVTFETYDMNEEFIITQPINQLL